MRLGAKRSTNPLLAGPTRAPGVICTEQDGGNPEKRALNLPRGEHFDMTDVAVARWHHFGKHAAAFNVISGAATP
jgi:hypothetical protein